MFNTITLYIIFSLAMFAMTKFSALNTPEQTEAQQVALNNQLPLFKQYPELKQTLPHKKIIEIHTPIIKLEKIGKTLKINNLYIKQDSPETLLRKLEFLFGDALELKAQSVLTSGSPAPESEAILTEAQKLNLRSTACLTPEPKNNRKGAPLASSSLDIRYYKTQAQRCIDIARIGAQETEQFGISPYYIPEKGSNKIGCIGSVNAVFELKEQIAQGNMPAPDLIYVAADTFGTAAGLHLGCKLAGIQAWIMIVQANYSQENSDDLIKKYFEETNKFLHEKLPQQIPLIPFHPQKGYFIRQELAQNNIEIEKKVKNALEILYRQEEILLNNIHSAKTFTTLFQDAQNKMLHHLTGKQQPVVLFWNSNSPSTQSIKYAKE